MKYGHGKSGGHNPRRMQVILTWETVSRLFDHTGRDLMFVSEVGVAHLERRTLAVQDEAAARRQADELPRLVLRDARDCLDIASRESDPDRRDKLTAKAGVLTKWARRCESSKTGGGGVRDAGAAACCKPV
jgi:hypothetical protein